MNGVLCSLLKKSQDQVVGRQDEDLYDPEIARKMNARSARVLEGQTVEVEETRPINGTTMTFLDTLMPLINESDEITGICGVSRNVTDRRKIPQTPHVAAEDYPSVAIRLTMERARVAARTDAMVLLQGESGSGKDFIAKWIHDHSHRSRGPYFSINCAALSRELVESELFGHERGAFTGAVQRKRGMLELAEGGTLLLNEIGELDLSLQSKLLVFLDNRTFMGVGGQQQIHVDARLIAASHRDLKEEVKQGRFLEPLFYRLSVFPIHVPALRERRDDIPILVEQLFDKLAIQLQIPETPVVEKQALAALAAYDWPGNVRELRNVLERSLMLWTGGPFKLAFPSRMAVQPQGDWSYTVRYKPGRNVQEVEDEVAAALYQEALRRSKGNKAEAARQLGLSRGALCRLLKRISE